VVPGAPSAGQIPANRSFDGCPRYASSTRAMKQGIVLTLRGFPPAYSQNAVAGTMQRLLGDTRLANAGLRHCGCL
jgi:hypothetical protein